jgi:antitoxin PrlF
MEDNRIIFAKAEEEKRDPAVDAFIEFLERDMFTRPDSLRAFPSELLDQGMALTKGIKVDLDAPIEIEGEYESIA